MVNNFLNNYLKVQIPSPNQVQTKIILIGSSIYPSPWHATTDCDPSSYSKRNCRFGLQIPETGCTKGSNQCSRNAGRNAWFTNYTSVPEMTIDKEFLDSRRIRSASSSTES